MRTKHKIISGLYFVFYLDFRLDLEFRVQIIHLGVLTVTECFALAYSWYSKNLKEDGTVTQLPFLNICGLPGHRFKHLYVSTSYWVV